MSPLSSVVCHCCGSGRVIQKRCIAAVMSHFNSSFSLCIKIISKQPWRSNKVQSWQRTVLLQSDCNKILGFLFFSCCSATIVLLTSQSISLYMCPDPLLFVWHILHFESPEKQSPQPTCHTVYLAVLGTTLVLGFRPVCPVQLWYEQNIRWKNEWGTLLYLVIRIL